MTGGADVNGGAIERRSGVWNANLFANCVSVRGPGRMLYLSGMGAEDVDDGHIHHPGDFTAQCRYAYEKIEAVLAREGASLHNVVKLTTYALDRSYREANSACRREAFAGVPIPAHTFLVVTGLAWPDMLVEVDVVAFLPD